VTERGNDQKRSGDQPVTNATDPDSGGPPRAVQDSGIGCVIAVIALNALLMGSLVSVFAFGPYSSLEQELWYRYGSLGFLLFGAILPAVALAFGARRSSTLMLLLISWMLCVLVAFLGYAMMSGGGV
jgi:hypothetical protein